MTRFILATAGAVALGLGISSAAHAQVAYGYSVPVYGGIQSTEGVVTPFGTQTFSSFYSPFTLNSTTVGATYTPFGAQGFANYASPFGSRSAAFSPFGTQTFSNFYNPFTFNSGNVGATYTPYGVQGFSNNYSPFGGGYGRSVNSNLITGTTFSTYGYNPWNGYSYGATITRPAVINPNYGFGGTYWRRR